MQCLVLFAQRGGNQGGDGAANAVTLVFQCGYLVIHYALLIFFCLGVSNCLQAIRDRNRTMQPGQAWLNLIPCFNLVWLILTVLKVSDSLRNEYEDRGLRGDGDFGRTMGILMYVFLIVCGPVGWIFLLIYRSKIAGYTRELEGRSSRDDDYDDEDRPSRRRRAEDEEDEDDRDRGRRRRRDEDDDR